MINEKNVSCIILISTISFKYLMNSKVAPNFSADPAVIHFRSSATETSDTPKHLFGDCYNRY